MGQGEWHVTPLLKMILSTNKFVETVCQMGNGCCLVTWGVRRYVLGQGVPCWVEIAQGIRECGSIGGWRASVCATGSTYAFVK